MALCSSFLTQRWVIEWFVCLHCWLWFSNFTLYLCFLSHPFSWINLGHLNNQYVTFSHYMPVARRIRSTLMATCTVCRDFHQNIWGEIILYLIDYCVCPTADILFIYAAVIGPNFSSAYLASCCLLFHSAKALWFIKCKHWRTVISFAFLLPSATVILPKPLFCSGWCLQPQMAHTPVV